MPHGSMRRKNKCKINPAPGGFSIKLIFRGSDEHIVDDDGFRFAIPNRSGLLRGISRLRNFGSDEGTMVLQFQ